MKNRLDQREIIRRLDRFSLVEHGERLRLQEIDCGRPDSGIYIQLRGILAALHSGFPEPSVIDKLTFSNMDDRSGYLARVYGLTYESLNEAQRNAAADSVWENLAIA